MSLMALTAPSDNIGYTPSILPTTSWGELASSYIDTTLLNYNMDSSYEAMRQAKVPRDAMYEQLTGSPVSSLWAGTSLRETGEDRDAIIDREILKLRGKDDRFNSVKTSEELRPDAKRIAQDQFQQTRELESRFEGSPFTAALAGGLVGSVQDPIQIWTLPIGASLGAGKSLLPFMLKEGAISMGIETAIQPAVLDWQMELGQKYGLGDVALNVLAAGAGGAALSGTLAGGVRLSSKLYDLAKKSPNADVTHALEEMAMAARQREAVPSADLPRHQRNLDATSESISAGRMPGVDDLDTRLIDLQDGIPAQAFAFLDPDTEFRVTTRLKDSTGKTLVETSAPKKVRDMTKDQLRKAVETRLLPDIKKDLDEAIGIMEKELRSVPMADINSINGRIKSTKEDFDTRVGALKKEIETLKDKLNKTRGRDKEQKARLTSDIARKEKTIREETGIQAGRMDKLTQKRNRAYAQRDKAETLQDFRKARSDILSNKVPKGDASPAKEIRAILDRVTEGANKAKKKVPMPIQEPPPKVGDIIERLDEAESLHESRLPMLMQEMEQHADVTFELDGKMTSVKNILEDTDGEDELLVVSSCGKGASS